MWENKTRQTYYYENYFIEFYKKQKPEVQKKIIWTLKLIETIDKVPEKYFKHLTGTSGLYEVRIEVGSDIFRIFSFFDKGKLVILINGFQKKTQKTPRNEIEMAEKLKFKYFEELKLIKK
jgi:phage-related protein